MNNQIDGTTYGVGGVPSAAAASTHLPTPTHSPAQAASTYVTAQVASTQVAPQAATQLDELMIENQRLQQFYEDISNYVEELKQRVQVQFSTPAQKRRMVDEFQKRFGISRRHACRLLNLSRSTMWYRSVENRQFTIQREPRFERLSDGVLLKRLKEAKRNHDRGFCAGDAQTVELIEFALRKLKLARAADLVKTNMNLAMEIFSVYLEQREMQSPRFRG